MHAQRLGARILLGFVTLGLACLAVVRIAYSDRWPFESITWAFLSSTALFHVTYLRVSFNAHTASRDRRPITHRHIDPQQIVEAAHELQAEMGLGEASFFIDAVGRPSIVLERITESVEPLIRSVVVNSGIIARLPRSRFEGRIVVPLLMMKRGELIDGLRLQDPQGNRVPSLSHIACASYAAAAVRRLITTMGKEALQHYTTTIERDVVELLASQKRTHQEVADRLSLRLSAIELEQESLGSVAPQLVGRIAAALAEMRTHYPIACHADVPKDPIHPTLRFSVSRRIVPDLFLERPGRLDGQLVRLRDTFRLCLGVRSSTVSLPLANAERAASYHVDVRGPEGTYLARQTIVRRDGHEASLTAEHYGLQARRGQRLAHLYVRSGTEFKELFFQATFFERMPGSIGPAALSAVAGATLVSTTAWVNMTNASLEGTDLVAVMLAFPAIASAWAGFGQSSSLLRGTLAAKVISGLTILAATAAALLHIAYNSQISDKPARSTLWIGVVSLAIGNALAAMGAWFTRGLTEGHFVRRPRNDEEG